MSFESQTEAAETVQQLHDRLLSDIKTRKGQLALLRNTLRVERTLWRITAEHADLLRREVASLELLNRKNEQTIELLTRICQHHGIPVPDMETLPAMH